MWWVLHERVGNLVHDFPNVPLSNGPARAQRSQYAGHGNGPACNITETVGASHTDSASSGKGERLHALGSVAAHGGRVSSGPRLDELMSRSLVATDLIRSACIQTNGSHLGDSSAGRTTGAATIATALSTKLRDIAAEAGPVREHVITNGSTAFSY